MSSVENQWAVGSGQSAVGSRIKIVVEPYNVAHCKGSRVRLDIRSTAGTMAIETGGNIP